MNSRRWLLFFLGLSVFCWTPKRARAFDLFFSEDKDVAQGNALMRRDEPTQALERYDAAAKRHPGRPEVHFNRGVALLNADRPQEAIESFERAIDTDRDEELTPRALYNLGLARHRVGAQLSGQNSPQAAAQALRAAADAYRRSLRKQPGNADAAWNLELARRQLEQLEQRASSSSDSDQKNSQNTKEDSEETKESSPEESSPSRGQSQEPQTPKPANGEQETSGVDGENRSGEHTDSAQRTQDRERIEAEAILDALEASEESLEKHRARTRARSRAKPRKNW